MNSKRSYSKLHGASKISTSRRSIRKNGNRFPAIVSVTAWRDERESIIGYLPIGTDNKVSNYELTVRAKRSRKLVTAEL